MKVLSLLLAMSFWPVFSQENAPKLLSLRLEPHSATLQGFQASQRFIALAKYTDGLERDVTSRCVISVSDAGVAKLDQRTRLVALSDGGTVLRASFAGRSAEAKIQVRDSGRREPFSFAREIETVFTRRGCNNSSCHGGVKGRGGFKLSLDALYPKEDYQWITEGGIYQVLSPEPKGPKIPRVNTKQPEKSLLLLKPTATVPHGGGLLFKTDSPDYQTLLNWIVAGAPYGSDNVRIQEVEVFPQDVILEANAKSRILVRARLSDGRREDITDRVRYEPSNPEVAKVSVDGFVEAVRPGETDVIIRAVGSTVSARVGVIANPLQNYPEIAGKNFIDDHVFARLRKLSIVPSEVSTDSEFLRRACLDLTGTLPPPERVREFIASNDPQKREKLIDILLNSPEYEDYWTFQFSDLFRVGSGGRGPDEYTYWQWVRDNIARNKPYDQIARERIAAQGSEGPTKHFLFAAKVRPLPAVVAEEVRVFMGRRMDCAQCHNHPFDSWSQDQFWGLAAFFSRATSTNWLADQVVFDDPDGQEMDVGEDGKNSLTFIRAMHPRTRKVVDPAFLDGTLLSEAKRENPRMALAIWMTSHPYFAEAAVNRMWGHFFGRGLVNPVDDFRMTNPPTHPGLLRALAADFKEHGYDLKHLMRRIVQSKTYQLSSTPNETNREDTVNYSHALPRPLEAEVLLDAISDATGVPEVFGSIAFFSTGAMAPVGTRAVNLRVPAQYLSRFLEVYGRPLRESVPERDQKANLTQALHMLVGSTYNEKLTKEGGRIDQLLRTGASDRAIIEELYLAALTRFPAEQEEAELEQMIHARASRRDAMEHLMWALISSREFADNH